MKLAITILSGLGMALMMAFNEYSPIAELQSILNHRRRYFVAAGFGFAAFLLAIAGFVTAVIEGALQLEVQGFLLWSALFSAAAVIAGTGLVCALLAQLILPKRELPAFSWAALDKKFQVTEMIEKWLQQMQEAKNEKQTEPAATEFPGADRFGEPSPQFSHH